MSIGTYMVGWEESLSTVIIELVHILSIFAMITWGTCSSSWTTPRSEPCLSP